MSSQTAIEQEQGGEPTSVGAELQRLLGNTPTSHSALALAHDPENRDRIAEIVGQLKRENPSAPPGVIVQMAAKRIALERKGMTPRTVMQPKPVPLDVTGPTRPITVGVSGYEDRDLAAVDPEAWAAMILCAVNGGPWPLVLHGDPGTGKTSAALLLLDRVSGLRRYTTAKRLCADLIDVQQGRDEHIQREESYWSRRWRECECCVLDELGARERVSDHQYETVWEALEQRKHRPTICISNLDLDRLEAIYDDRIASRLAGGTVIEFTGADRRLMKAESH